MATKPWTEYALLKDLFEILKRPDTSVRFEPLGDCRACAGWDQETGRGIWIAIDIFQYGLIPGVIHELRHYQARRKLADYSSELQEPQVDSVEEKLWKYLGERPYLERRWRKAIAQKLAKSQAGQ